MATTARFQFRLRTLFIVMTAIAVYLGLLVEFPIVGIISLFMLAIIVMLIGFLSFGMTIGIIAWLFSLVVNFLIPPTDDEPVSGDR